LLSLFAILVSLSLAGLQTGPVTGAAALLVIAGAFAGRLRVSYLVGRTAIILPFAGAAAAITAWTAGLATAGVLLVRAVLSAAAVVVVAGTTRTPDIASALQRLGLPLLVADTVLLTLRYIESIMGEAATIQRAVIARGGNRSWSVSGSGIGVLFASSFRRSESVHRAMLARGYSGTILVRTGATEGSASADALVVSIVLVTLALGWAWMLWSR
jgi:cobalt/nickel transport system permease protein